MTDNETAPISIPVEYVVSNELKTIYTTDLIVQHSNSEFVLLFFETRPPVLLGSQEDVEKSLANIGVLKSECIARIVVAPNRMPIFIQALVENFTKFQVSQNPNLEHNED